MSACPQRRTLRLEMGRHSGQPMETRGCLAEWDDRNERIVLHCSTQAHFNLRTGVAEVLRVPEHQVQVIAPDVGGGFGIKHPMYPEEIVCSLLAKRLRRPVKWIEDRREHMLTACHSPSTTTTSKSASTTTASCKRCGPASSSTAAPIRCGR